MNFSQMRYSKQAAVMLFVLSLIGTRLRVVAQAVEVVPVQVAEELTFGGTIDGKYRVTMIVKEEKSVTYSEDGCRKETNVHLSGWYSYNSVGDRIVLVGIRTDESTIVLHELDAEFNKSATFKGSLRGQKLTGTWTNLKNGSTLPFQLDRQSSAPQQLGLRIANDHGGVHSVLLFSQPNEYRQASYEVKFNQKKANSYYVVLTMSTPSCGIFNCRGPCCGGLEEELVWVKLSERGEIEGQQRVVINSCYNSVYTDDSNALTENSDEVVRMVVDDIRNSASYTVEFSVSQPEKGLVTTVEHSIR